MPLVYQLKLVISASDHGCYLTITQQAWIQENAQMMNRGLQKECNHFKEPNSIQPSTAWQD